MREMEIILVIYLNVNLIKMTNLAVSLPSSMYGKL